MATVTFDTLKFVEKLKAAGFPEAQAKALVEAHAEAFSEIAEGQLATKADSVRIERRIDTVEASLKQEIADVKAEVRLLKWMVGFVLAGIAFILLRLLIPGALA